MKTKILALMALMGLAVLLMAALSPAQLSWRATGAKRVHVDKGTTSVVVSLPGLRAGGTVGATFLGFGDLSSVAAVGATRTAQVAYQTTTTAITNQIPNSCWSTSNSLAIVRWPVAVTARDGITVEVHYVPGK